VTERPWTCREEVISSKQCAVEEEDRRRR
jgi:hypothetical protein